MFFLDFIKIWFIFASESADNMAKRIAGFCQYRHRISKLY